MTRTIGPLRVQPECWVALHVDDPLMADLLADRLRDLVDVSGIPTHVLEVRRHDESPTHPWGVWRDGEPCETTLTGDYVVAYVLWELNRAVTEHRSERVAVHAGAVEINGRGVVLCGASHHGKSTLTAWLTVHGFGFLTDEIVALGEPGERLVAYPRPIGLRRGGPIEPFIGHIPEPWLPYAQSEWLVPASTLGAGRLSTAAEFTAFVMVRYLPGERTAVSELSPEDALLAICDQSPGLGLHRRHAFRRLADWMNQVPSYRLIVDDLSGVAELVAEIVS